MAKPVPRPKLVHPPPYSAKEFFLDDVPRTFFPLSTNRVLVEAGHAEIRAQIGRIVAGDASFLPQRRVHANKDELHLRRTVKLDPVAELFIYDLVYRNRKLVIQCKHWLSNSVNLQEVAGAKEQMALWTDPKVDILIVATSGRFTADAVQWVEAHNTKGESPRVEMWPESHLERLLRARPGLIAEFGMRG